jgi:prolyl oligopeptidase
MRTPIVLGVALMTALPSPAAQSPWNYPAAPRGQTVDTYHGVKVADPYRWLEELDSKETRQWVEEENRLTFGFLEALPQRTYFRDRLQALWNFPRLGLPFKEGGRYFLSRNSGLQNQAVFLVQDTLSAEPRVLIDPNTLSPDDTIALTATHVSFDGKWVAYSTAAAGSDWNEIRVRSVDDGTDTADVIQWVKFAEPSWTKDNAGFFYSRYPAAPADAENAKTFSALEHQRIYYHKLGTPQSADRLVYERADEPKWFLSGTTTEDGRYLVITTSRGASPENLLSIVDLGDPAAPKLDAKAVPLVSKWNAACDVIGNDGPVLYVLTNLDAPRKRVVAIDTRNPDPARWKTLIPESADTIDSVLLVGGRFVVRTMHDASSRLIVHDRSGARAGEIALPGIGTVTAMTGHQEDPELFYNFVSFTTPATNFRYDVQSRTGSVFAAPRLNFNPADYETTQVFYASKDGTKIPMFISHRKGLKIDANTPTLLYGYGGFDISLTPSFSVSNLVWMEAGGIFAQPNLRGGGEYGKAWHEAGTKERKQNVFDDFIAAAEWLFAHRLTSPAHLVLSGGSNGGLLVASTVNQRPDLCRVALPAVGVMDMLRFHRFTVGFAWVSDYGSSDDPRGFKYLRAYSPLHTIKAGAKYPAILVTTADHDDRVYPAHSFKYTAALQAEAADTPDSGPIMIRIETRAGHGAGKPTSKQIEESADRLAFAAHFLGLEPRHP